MPAENLRIPTYRHHKARDLAVVHIDGRDVYLGPYNSPESRAKYDRVIAEWLGRGRATFPTSPRGRPASDLTISELILAFLEWAGTHYSRGGHRTREYSHLVLAMRPLRRLYGAVPAHQFGPLKLKALRTELATQDLARREVNRRVKRIVAMFRWAVGEELLAPDVHQKLAALAPIAKGRTTLRESEPVRPIDDDSIEAIRPFVDRRVWAMVQLQRLTGMRPGEVIILRAGDIDRSDAIWVYRPSSHKTAWRGKTRAVPLGPRAQEVLAPWLKDDPMAFLFDPSEAHVERMASLRKRRKTKVQPSQRDRSKPRARHRPGDHYRQTSYGHAIARGCKQAGIPVWSPNRLRHTAATAIRAAIDLEAARAVLGHSSADTTEIYAERDLNIAKDVAARLG